VYVSNMFETCLKYFCHVKIYFRGLSQMFQSGSKCLKVFQKFQTVYVSNIFQTCFNQYLFETCLKKQNIPDEMFKHTNGSQTG
jgi:hypothetical protein